MKEGMGMDGAAPSLYPVSKKQKKKKKKKNTDIIKNMVYSDLNKEINRTNRALAVSNVESKKERCSMLQTKYRDLPLKVIVLKEKGLLEQIRPAILEPAAWGLTDHLFQI